MCQNFRSIGNYDKNNGRHGKDTWPTTSKRMPIAVTNCCKVLETFCSCFLSLLSPLTLLSLLSQMSQISRCQMYFHTALVQMQASADMFALVCLWDHHLQYKSVASLPCNHGPTNVGVLVNHNINQKHVLCLYKLLSLSYLIGLQSSFKTFIRLFKPFGML